MSNLSPPEIRAIIAEELNRLATALDKGGYEWIAACIQDLFPLPSPPLLPSPADDWRKACVVEQVRDRYWVVRSPDKKHFLRFTLNSWCEEHAPTIGNFPDEAEARIALAKAPPYPGYTPPLPAKVEGDGTVDAAFVAANAGRYTWPSGAHGVGTLSPANHYVSDGNGDVLFFCDHGETPLGSWDGIRRHMDDGTRFMPRPSVVTPLPPKDNKCESSSGGEPVNTPCGTIIVVGQASLNNLITLRGKYRDTVAEAEKAKGEIERLKAELAGVRERMEPFRLAEGFYEKLNPPYAPNWKCLSDDTRRFYTEAAEHASRPLAPAEVRK